MLLGLLSLVNEASLNQRAVGSTPTRPTKFFNFCILLLDSVNLVPTLGVLNTSLRLCRTNHDYAGFIDSTTQSQVRL